MATEKTFYLETFGCQMNAHDSEKVIGTLQQQGYRQVESELVDELHDLVLVHHDLSRQRNVTGVLDQVLEAVKQLVDLYLNFSFSALATGGGTRSDTCPP